MKNLFSSFKSHWIWIIVLFAIAISIIPYCATFKDYELSRTTTTWGNFGSYVAGILGTTLGFLNLFLLMHFSKKQNDSNNLSQFEATFFRLIDNHRKKMTEICGDDAYYEVSNACSLLEKSHNHYCEALSRRLFEDIRTANYSPEKDPLFSDEISKPILNNIKTLIEFIESRGHLKPEQKLFYHQLLIDSLWESELRLFVDLMFFKDYNYYLKAKEIATGKYAGYLNGYLETTEGFIHQAPKLNINLSSLNEFGESIKVPDYNYINTGLSVILSFESSEFVAVNNIYDCTINLNENNFFAIYPVIDEGFPNRTIKIDFKSGFEKLFFGKVVELPEKTINSLKQFIASNYKYTDLLPPVEFIISFKLENLDSPITYQLPVGVQIPVLYQGDFNFSFKRRSPEPEEVYN